jgi:hypothetical protein
LCDGHPIPGSVERIRKMIAAIRDEIRQVAVAECHQKVLYYRLEITQNSGSMIVQPFFRRAPVVLRPDV